MVATYTDIHFTLQVYRATRDTYSLYYTRTLGRNSNYSLPQNLPHFFIDPRSVQLTFAIVDTINLPPHPACAEALLHLTCGAAAPPCDSRTQRPLPICNDSYRAYNQLMSDGICDDF